MMKTFIIKTAIIAVTLLSADALNRNIKSIEASKISMPMVFVWNRRAPNPTIVSVKESSGRIVFDKISFPICNKDEIYVLSFETLNAGRLSYQCDVDSSVSYNMPLYMNNGIYKSNNGGIYAQGILGTVENAEIKRSKQP